MFGLDSIFNVAGKILDKIWPPQADPAKKLEAQLTLQTMLEERENTVIAAQREIIVAEMQQGDNYTKRARPTIVYAGLAFIFLNHVFVPFFAFFSGRVIPNISLPDEFWWAWTGAVGIWMVGRTMEKRGSAVDIVSTITGTKK